MRSAAPLLLAVALAGCGNKPGKSAPTPSADNGNSLNGANAVPSFSGVEANAAPGDAAEPVPRKSSPSTDAPIGSLPPAGKDLRFVGLWASAKADCASRPWHFTDHKLSRPGAPECTFKTVTKVAGGYDVAAECGARSEVRDLIELRFAESARAMLVESRAISPTGLIYCGS